MELGESLIGDTRKDPGPLKQRVKEKSVRISPKRC